MRGKLIIIEGTDCSGKETQSNRLLKYLQDKNIKAFKSSFPMYNTPTGKIIGGPYLGKEKISNGWFEEGASNVEPKVASLYFAADRRYNINLINEKLNSGVHVILDRYVYSNMAHQGGKIKDASERLAMYNWLDTLEFKLLELPVPDIALFLHMPYLKSIELKKDRNEAADQHEMDDDHLQNAEIAYLELANNYHWKIIECVDNGKIRAVDDINQEINRYILDKIKGYL